MVPAPAPAVAWRERMAFAVGGMTAATGAIGLKVLAIPVYQMTLMVDPAMLGLMLAIPRFWDAFTDPLIGHWSDRSRTRFGRRRPFIVVGAVMTGIAFSLVWMVPVHWPEPALLGWFLATSLFFYTCYSLWEIPYQSLGYELSANYHERTAIMGTQNLLCRLAVMVEWVFPLAQNLVLLGLVASVMHGVRTLTVVLAAVVFVGLGMIPGLFVRERFHVSQSPAARERRPSFWDGCTAALRNHSMRVLMTLVVLSFVASMFTSGLDYYLLVYYVCGGDIFEGSLWKALMSSGFAVVGVVSVGVVAWLCRRIDKRNALIAVYGVAVLGGIAKWYLFREGVPWLCLFVPLLCAPIFAASDIVVRSMIADICDQDELDHGVRREGVFGAMHSWVGKTAAALAIFGAGLTLNLVGFEAGRGAAQDPEALLRIRYVLVAATCLPAIAAIVVLRFYPLNEGRMAEVRQSLDLRRASARSNMA